MDDEQISELLKEGVAAVKVGDSTKALDLLQSVVQNDRANVPAWLWLSEVVETDEERRMCLENVLVLDPNNSAVQRGLDRLSLRSLKSEDSDTRHVVRRKYEPSSLAQAVLYPERLVKEWEWQDQTAVVQAEKISFKHSSKFDDVWERDSEICAYCAHELEYDDQRCPNCRHRIVSSFYRYPKVSSDLIIYIVLLLGVAQAYFLLVLMDMIIYRSLLLVAWHGFILAVISFLIVGIFFRRFWVYVASIIILLAILVGLLLGSSLDLSQGNVASSDSMLTVFESMAGDPIFSVARKLEQFVRPLIGLATFLALLYAIFRVGPDFQRVKSRNTAGIQKGIDEASGFYSAGKEHAQAKRWASAILHWQRAAALDPSRSYYQRVLGVAYSQLGFYKRSIDVLESAKQLSNNSKVQEELAELITSVNAQIEMEQTEV